MHRNKSPNRKEDRLRHIVRKWRKFVACGMLGQGIGSLGHETRTLLRGRSCGFLRGSGTKSTVLEELMLAGNRIRAPGILHMKHPKTIDDISAPWITDVLRR